MTVWQGLGAIIMAIPLVLLALAILWFDGWRVFAYVFGTLAGAAMVTLPCVFLGMALLEGKVP